MSVARQTAGRLARREGRWRARWPAGRPGPRATAAALGSPGAPRGRPRIGCRPREARTLSRRVVDGGDHAHSIGSAESGQEGDTPESPDHAGDVVTRRLMALPGPRKPRAPGDRDFPRSVSVRILARCLTSPLARRRPRGSLHHRARARPATRLCTLSSANWSPSGLIARLAVFQFVS